MTTLLTTGGTSLVKESGLRVGRSVFQDTLVSYREDPRPTVLGKNVAHLPVTPTGVV